MKGASAQQKKQERQWEVDSALSTLKRAQEIRQNSSLMKEVKKAATDLAKSVGAGQSNRSTPPKKKK